MRQDLAKVRTKNLRIADTTDKRAIIQAEQAWTRFADTVDDRFGHEQRGRAIDLITRLTLSTANTFYRIGRRGALAELQAMVPAAATAGAKGPENKPNEQTLRGLAAGIIQRIEPGLEGLADKTGGLISEFYQVERLVQTEAFIAYGNALEDVSKGLARNEDPSKFRVTGFDPNEAKRKGDPSVLAGIVKQWDATLDSRTCPVCKRLDGKITLLALLFEGVYQSPAHPKCRCITGYYPVAIPIT